MKTCLIIVWSLAFNFIAQSNIAQTHTQTIKGTITDKDSKMPLIGANVSIKSLPQVVGASTDIEGFFRINDIPIGRHDIEISYLGYEPMVLNALLLTSGKELVLNIELIESAISLETAVVVAEYDKTKTINDMATVSARSFSVEETSRYASSFYDPARMAQNYAGVTVAGGNGDLFNGIVVRGNSPSGVLWRLEGIEIPNPNHFGSLGSSGGAISMLSSSTLSNSDFYTGAFPSEFGNAISGVFDLNMRSGNSDKREYSFMLGALGVEAAIEGPFSKNSNASYLINYRYSTLAALSVIGLNPVGDVLPEYQDLSFKINVPTEKAGVFSLFGLAGKNRAYYEPTADSLIWESDDDKWGFEERQKVATIGLSHKFILTDNSYLKTVLSGSYNQYEEEDYWLDRENNYKKMVDLTSTFDDKVLRLSSTYTNKINAKNTVRAGVIISQMDFDFKFKETDEDTLRIYLDNRGAAQMIQAFGHWKYRISEDWTLNTGLHYTLFTLNNNYSIEPRAGIQWQFSPKQTLSAALGLHSKPEHVSFYFIENTLPGGERIAPNKDLDMTKSLHAVLGYDHLLGKNLHLKTELYFQHLYDVPIEKELGSKGSIINAQDIWDVIGATEASNDGTARNYGIDLTLEKFFANDYYFLITGSLFESKFTPQDGKEYNTRYNSNYQLNLLSGKEFKVGKKKNNIIGLNGKFLIAGGNRLTPIDFEASQLKGETVFYEDLLYSEQAKTYYRFDIGVSYKINKKKATHTIMLDIQNVTNHQNVYFEVYDSDTNAIKTYYQTGLFPNFNYRIEF